MNSNEFRINTLSCRLVTLLFIIYSYLIIAVKPIYSGRAKIMEIPVPFHHGVPSIKLN